MRGEDGVLTTRAGASETHATPRGRTDERKTVAIGRGGVPRLVLAYRPPMRSRAAAIAAARAAARVFKRPRGERPRLFILDAGLSRRSIVARVRTRSRSGLSENW